MGKTALVIVDVQNDFLPAQGDRPEGSLAVADGNAVIPVIKDLLDQTQWDWDVVIATQDYHPAEHISFASSNVTKQEYEPFSSQQLTNGNGEGYTQVMWPPHCQQGQPGAEIEKSLRDSFELWKGKMKIVRKGCHPLFEAYSPFDGGYVTEATDPAEPTSDLDSLKPGHSPLKKFLHEQEVSSVVVTGLATDYCVKATAISALSAGFHTVLVAPAARGVSPKQNQAVFDAIESWRARDITARGTVVGRRPGDDWLGDLQRWLKEATDSST